jgi:muramoyltetrapeptide carboxypeptidase
VQPQTFTNTVGVTACLPAGKSVIFLIFLVMHRKNFLSFIASSALSFPLSGYHKSSPAVQRFNPKKFAIPPYLQAGDTIGITCPAGYISHEAIQPSVKLMESWGYKIREGSTVGKRDFTFGGSDNERMQDFQQMLDDPGIKAIMCARGGYGAVRTIDMLNFERFADSPKWIIGFSDITVLHSHLARNVHVASIHSKMCNSFPDDWSLADVLQKETIISIRDAIAGQKMSYTTMPHARNRAGTAKGTLVGGNMKTLETLTGTKSDLITDGCLLFVEDTNENLYSIDRMFRHFKRSGKLSNIHGLIIGGFKVKPDDPGEEFGRNLYDIVWDQVREYRFPVTFDFPVGHQKNNFALKCGVIHELTVKVDSSTLREVSGSE